MNEYKKPVRSELKMKPITVAVIDDGANLEALSSASFDGWYPEKVPLPHGLGNSWYLSTGHGTEMVRLIQMVCPHASFFIGKLDTHRAVYNSVSESAAKVSGTSTIK
jgi:hypothetical protein